jgi:hypothetical protein
MSVYEHRDMGVSKTTLLMDSWGRALDLSFMGFGSIKLRTQDGIYLGSGRPEAKDPTPYGWCILVGLHTRDLTLQLLSLSVVTV